MKVKTEVVKLCLTFKCARVAELHHHRSLTSGGSKANAHKNKYHS